MSDTHQDFVPTSPIKDEATPSGDGYEQGPNATFDSFQKSDDFKDGKAHDKSLSPYPYQEYSNQQLSEINMFSANATVGDDDKDVVSNVQHENISKQIDEDTQKHEINMFAAYANAEFGEDMTLDDANLRRDAQENEIKNVNVDSSVSNAHDMEEDKGRREQKMSVFASFKNSESDDEISMNQDNTTTHQTEEEHRRHREMNMFAVYANADLTENDSWDTYASQTKVSSGTFVLGKQGSKTQNVGHTSSDSCNKNLSAALASLTYDGDSLDTKDRSDSSQTNSTRSFPNNQRKPKHTEPYTACVLAQKPLFFGNVIPETVKKTMENELCSALEPSKWNNCLKSAIETFSYNGAVDRNQMLSYVKLYEPVWGNESRLKREDRIAKASKDHTSKNGLSCNAEEDLPGSNGSSSTKDLNKDGISDLVKTQNTERGRVEKCNKVDTSDSIGESDIHQNLLEQESDDLSSNLFLQYARDGAIGGTLIPVPETRVLSSDPNGSFEDNELKKEVGLNDNLKKALESLSISSTNMSISVVEASETAAYVMGMKESVKDGRPLSNYEITQGKVPLYACDDEPLPSLPDLGKFETREDQQSFNKRCESQEIIASQTVPNIFGNLICPSPALGPQDNQSWLKRDENDEVLDNPAHQLDFSLLDQNNSSHRKSISLDTRTMSLPKKTSYIPSPLPPPPTKRLLPRHQTLPLPNRYDIESTTSSFMSENDGENQGAITTIRKGWWNSLSSKIKSSKRRKHKPDSLTNTGCFVQRPWRDLKRPQDYSSIICPQSESLIELNRPLSELHPAVEEVKHLPLLSDRYPSTRSVQIDTQIVGFPSIGEIEPLFCSMSLWHVQANSDSGFEQNIADWSKCGKITESLKFDMVNKPEIEELYKKSLYFPSRVEESHLLDLRSTRCGIFPIPGSYEISDIHAVLLVHKVLGDDTDLDAYWNLDSASSLDQKLFDSVKIRERALKRSWHFLTPFAFGVVPLVQIINSEAPTSPTSRACQIPLFRYKAGDDPNQIVNHILAINYPSKYRKPADITNGGKAMLVIRDFGYMGLHASLSSKSKFACDRLVDFSGEVQVRRRAHDDVISKIDSEGGKIEILDGWHDEVLIEPAQNGGRNMLSHRKQNECFDYCQELASIPLHFSDDNIPKSLRSEIGFNTSFSNELILIPTSLEKCPRRNITVKIEVVRVQSHENESRLIATPMTPCIHNARRGSFMVKESYTNAAYHKESPMFSDDIKIKLPLEPLVTTEDGQIAILFTVFHISVNARKKWSLTTGNTNEPPFMSQIGCGYLPLSSEIEISSLRPNGMYSVEIKFRSTACLNSQDSKNGTVYLEPLVVDTSGSSDHSKERMRFTENLDENAESKRIFFNESGNSLENLNSHSFDTDSSVFDHMMTKSGMFKEFKSKSQSHPSAILKVRLVSLSSLHLQNKVLSKFFNEIPLTPHLLHDPDIEGEWKISQTSLHDETNRFQYESKSEQIKEDTIQNILAELSKSVMCPHTELTKHFLRILPQLWRLLVCGIGKPSVAVANPANMLPLRLSTFSTLLYVIHSVSFYLYKNEKMEADGVTRFNMTTMSKIVGMLFDEDQLFSRNDEPMDDGESLLNEEQRENCAVSETSEQKPSSSKETKTFSKICSGSDECASANVASTISLNTRDDLVLLKPTEKPTSIRNRSFSAPLVKPLKIDTKTDFQLALNAAHSPSSSLTTLSSVTVGPAASRRKWLGESSSLLATIEENSDNIVSSVDKKYPKRIDRGFVFDNLDSELVIHNDIDPSKLKQMRVPQSIVDIENVNLNDVDTNSIDSIQSSVKTVPNMDEIEAAGEAFLDAFGNNLGISSPRRERSGEERRVGISHHRKTKSRCSIDWTLPPTDRLIENQQQLQVIDHVSSDLSKLDASSSGFIRDVEPTTSKDSEKSFQGTVNEDLCLPTYEKRIRQENTRSWFPFTYEVLIFNWTAILSEQRRRGSKSSINLISSQYSREPLVEVSKKTFGLTVSCAPVLFAVIKKSLAFRIHSLFSSQEPSLKAKHKISSAIAHSFVELDDTIMSTLEELVTMLTDACIDSRNFDSWSFRNTSILVNDAIVYFLVDLFALIDHKKVHRLVLAYFSRFVCKDGKQWQDRDSKIGLRCSWEVTKMRLNAVTAFVRFADFLHVNKPIMEKWGSWAFRPPCQDTRHLYLQAIEEIDGLNMSAFSLSGSSRKNELTIPPWKHHWLAELVMDICLDATGHVEQSIQLRAASILYELFWSSNTVGRIDGCLTAAASLYISFMTKILGQIDYISTLPSKCNFRSYLLSCVVFVMQSAPFGILRALYGKLCREIEDEKHIISSTTYEDQERNPSILDLLSLLNLILATLEYDGDEAHARFSKEWLLKRWRTEHLLSPEYDVSSMSESVNTCSTEMNLTSTSSRKWFSHDASVIVINTCRNIVREYLNLQVPATSLKSSDSDFVPDDDTSFNKRDYFLDYTHDQKLVFIRAISSVYLNCLTLRESDIVFNKTLVASVEIVKVFGIKLFIQAIGDTLQHWMRLVLFHCGAKRSKVRVEALELLALMLRLQWDSYGTFTRIRIPLLAVQTEVMERIVAKAVYKHNHDQSNPKGKVYFLSNHEAEAALTPLWRTLHRLHHSSASNNAAFKSALQLLAYRMKTLYKAYIAAYALASANRDKTPAMLDEKIFRTLRVVMESAEFSKEITGNNQNSLRGETVTIHYEVVEDAFLAAANVFVPTELPLHRVAWLKKLAEFHSLRNRYAEEAACRLQIHKTLQIAGTLYGCLWNSSPFSPWVNDHEIPDFINTLNYSLARHERRLFYRSKDSVRVESGDWGVGGNKTLFNGVAFASEYNRNSSWISLREIEREMVQEAEEAGELFLRAGIIESSRFCWSLATKYYIKVFDYARLAICYKKLAHVVASEVPTIDTSSQLELSSPLGRFYRVYFHGGASGNLMGREFVYRADVSVKLESFCKYLQNMLVSILPDKTPIELVLDDGRAQEIQKGKLLPKRQLGAVPREQMIVKVTPLKPILSQDRFTIGSSEWFYMQIEAKEFSKPKHRAQSSNVASNHDRDSGAFSTRSNVNSGVSVFGRPLDSHHSFISSEQSEKEDGESTVKRFSFSQPRDRTKGSRDLLKGVDGNVAEKSLRVTELLLSESLPNCTSRQPVAVEHRSVFNQSPLEASVEAVCGWCAVLFRTAVATNGASVLGNKLEQGIGKAAVKVIADCMYHSRVKEFGSVMLETSLVENYNNNVANATHERLSAHDVKKHQIKLSRAIVIFMELLHVLIGKNRDLLLSVNKMTFGELRGDHDYGNLHSPGCHSDSENDQVFDDESGTYGESTIGTMGTMDRTDKAKALQRELQIAFTSMIKTLYPLIHTQIHSETPYWMNLCLQDNYFSSGLYRRARIAIGEELLFFGSNKDSALKMGESYTEERGGIPISILPSRSFSDQDHESYSERSVTSRTNTSRGGSCVEFQQT